jgi:hypothetical protein
MRCSFDSGAQRALLCGWILLVLGTIGVAGAPHQDSVPLWHQLTLDFRGPQTSESATPNPFTDYRLEVTFTQGERSLVVPGYYAADGDAANTSADGDAANTSADSGAVWRVHFVPDALGRWSWQASFRTGPGVAIDNARDAGQSAKFIDGSTGQFTVVASDKQPPDLRALGRLQYVGTRYPHTLGNNRLFLKAGADAPENFLAYRDFDGAFKSDGHKDHLVKTWEPHVRDWRPGDPTWGDQKGKGIIGAVNYLASQGMNVVSMLTLNIGGDDRNVFPYTTYTERDRLDVSRLQQWQIVLDHATTRGLMVHFKTQETENETLLDEGATGPQRRLYYRELIARFGHLLALNWNLGEENGPWGKPGRKKNFQSTAQRLAMAEYFQAHDPYGHPIVIHNGQWPEDLYGAASPLAGASLQTSHPQFKFVHPQTVRLLRESAAAGKPWMVACDEPGDAQHALLPDEEDPDHFHARTNGLWGHFLAGGWGVEWYFGYQHPHSDMTCQDFRSREVMWKQSAHALRLLRSHDLPLEEMECRDALLAGAPGFCLAQSGQVYVALVIDPQQPAALDLQQHAGTYQVHWYDPRQGGPLQTGSIASITGPGKQPLG